MESIGMFYVKKSQVVPLTLLELMESIGMFYVKKRILFLSCCLKMKKEVPSLVIKMTTSQIFNIGGYINSHSLYEDGVLISVSSDKEYLIYHDSCGEKYPIMKTDMVFATGYLTEKVVAGQKKELFIAEKLITKPRVNLMTILAKSFPKTTQENLQEMVLQFETYASMTGKSVTTSLGYLSNNYVSSPAYYENEVKNLGSMVFPYEDEKISFDMMKHFIYDWYNKCLIRPLQLMGISEEIIATINIPLIEVNEICETNPLRIPEIPFDVAMNIFTQFLLSEPTRDQMICGKINRFVYHQLDSCKWTSVPFLNLLSKFSSFYSLLPLLEKEYFVKTTEESLYLTYILKIENAVISKISNLIRKPLVQNVPLFFPREKVTISQENAINGALTNWISLIYGGAGTGKTTILKHIIRNADRIGKKAICLSFTGKAVTRIREVLEEDSLTEMCHIATIDLAIVKAHDFNIVIIDEISMVNTHLFYKFCKRYHRSPEWSLVMIGDINQLKPIGWGSLLRQLLQTGIPKFSLDQNFRSDETIIQICNSVIDKRRIIEQKFVPWRMTGSDYSFKIGGICCVEDLLKEFYQKMLKSENFSVYRNDITIITPFRKSVEELNLLFQEIFYEGQYQVIDNRKWFVDERVMMLNNNYTINIMNGSTGYVKKIHPYYIIVQFRENPCLQCPFIEPSIFLKLQKIHNETTKNSGRGYTEKELELYLELKDLFPFIFGSSDFGSGSFVLNDKTLCHAYSLTVHKSQGSQYKNTIFFLPHRNSNFIDTTMLYTGLSRAQKNLYIVVEDETLINSGSLKICTYIPENLGSRINLECQDIINYQPEKSEIIVNDPEEDTDHFDLSDFE
jgi:hypothetical protein